MSVSQDQVVDYIKNLRLADVKALIETLESELGVSASAPIMMGGPMAGAAAEPVEEQTEFTVILASFGEKKIDVIKVVREITGLGLKDAKSMVESAGPDAKIKEGIPKEEADKIKKSLEDAGAKVEVK